MAVDVGVSDMWQVTSDTQNVTCGWKNNMYNKFQIEKIKIIQKKIKTSLPPPEIKWAQTSLPVQTVASLQEENWLHTNAQCVGRS